MLTINVCVCVYVHLHTYIFNDCEHSFYNYQYIDQKRDIGYSEDKQSLMLVFDEDVITICQ